MAPALTAQRWQVEAAGAAATVPPMSSRQRYRLRAPSTGREILLEADPDETYVDSETGEPLEIVGMTLPLAPSPSNLPWAVENLRMCACGEGQLVQKDLNDCPWCGRRLPPIG